jgi:hypothetical protein
MLNIQSNQFAKSNQCKATFNNFLFTGCQKETDKLNVVPSVTKDVKPIKKHQIMRESKVNKAYEMYKGTISESYFDVSDPAEARNFVDDYANNLNNGLIVVIDNCLQINEVINFSGNVNGCIKLVIRYNSLCDCNTDSAVENTSQINTKSIKQAVNEAYNRIENNQAILFAHVHSNFDLFEHLDEI